MDDPITLLRIIEADFHGKIKNHLRILEGHFGRIVKKHDAQIWVT